MEHAKITINLDTSPPEVKNLETTHAIDKKIIQYPYIISTCT